MTPKQKEAAAEFADFKRTATTRRMKCSCCGADAGRWEQWPNRDTGFGVCASCIDWLKQRGSTEAELQDLYGRPGIHYASASEQA
jgi:hypothetical protein